MARFSSLMTEQSLFGAIRGVSPCGQIGSSGREIVEQYPDTKGAGEALETLAQRGRREAQNLGGSILEKWACKKKAPSRLEGRSKVRPVGANNRTGSSVYFACLWPHLGVSIA